MSDGRPATTKQASSASFHYVAGLTSGLLSAVLLQPADLLKTRVQQCASNTLRGTLRDIVRGPNALRSLWRGTIPSALRTGFGSAIYFGGLNALRTHAAQYEAAGAKERRDGAQKTARGDPSIASSSSSTTSTLPRLSRLANLTTGAVARASAGFVLMPMTVIKVRYESDLYRYGSIIGAARDIVRSEGLRGLFVGSVATAFRDAPYAGLYLLFYEESKRRLGKVAGRMEERTSAADHHALVDTSSSPPRLSGSMAAGINFTSGVIGACVATALTNPFDAIKTRIQLRPREYGGGSAVRAARRMIGEDGYRALFDGLGLRIARKALSSALTWTLYEELVRRAEGAWSRGVRAADAVL